MSTEETPSQSDVIISSIPSTFTGNTSLDEVIELTGHNGSFSSNSTSFSDGEYEDYVNPLEETTTKVIFIILYVVVFTCAFCGNLLVLVVVLKHRRMRTITNFFLANLAVADFAVSIFCVLPNLFLNLTLKWSLGRVMCKLYFFVQAMSYTASITILTVISAERYFAIIYPLRSKQMTTMCMLRVAVIIVWMLAAASGVPFLVIYDQVTLSPMSDMHFCMPSSQLNVEAYTVCNFVIWYLAPLIVISIMYTRISMVLWRTSRQGPCLPAVKQKAKVDHEIKILVEPPAVRLSHRQEEADDSDGFVQTRLQSLVHIQCEESCGSRISDDSDDDRLPQYKRQSPRTIIKPSFSDPHHLTTVPYRDKAHIYHGHGRRNTGIATPDQIRKHSQLLKEKKPEKALLQRRKVIRLLIAVVVSFALCVLPYHIRVLWQNLKKPTPEDWHLLLPPITFVFYYLNSAVNPVLYAFMSDKFRQSLLDIVKCRSYRRQRQNSFSMKTMNSGVQSLT